MISDTMFKVLDIMLFFVPVFAFLFWQIWSVEKTIKERKAKEAAAEAEKASVTEDALEAPSGVTPEAEDAPVLDERINARGGASEKEAAS